MLLNNQNLMVLYMFINYALFTGIILQFAAHEYQPFTHKDGQQHICLILKGRNQMFTDSVETPKNNNCGKTMKVLLTKH